MKTFAWLAVQLRRCCAIGALGLSLIALVTLACSSLAAPAPLVPVHYFEDLFSTAITPAAWWLVGSKSLVLVSADKGRHWERRSLKERSGGSLMQDFDLYSIRFAADGKAGWIGGEHGLIFYTGDGGDSWQPRPAPMDENVFRVAPVDSRRACAVGTDGMLLCTADAGEHWTPQVVSKFIDLNDITFVGEEGWAVGEYRTIMHTSDGGATWQLQLGGNPKILEEESYFAVAFADAQHGWVAGLAGEVASTDDGGHTWRQSGGNGRPSIFAIGPAWPAIWFGGKRGVLLERTNDDRWHDIRISFGDITDIAFDNRTGIATGLGGTVLQTMDGGNSWHSVDVE